MQKPNKYTMVNDLKDFVSYSPIYYTFYFTFLDYL